MTKGELAVVLGVSEGYLEKNEKKVLEQRRKTNIEIIKSGRGKNAEYGVKFPWMIEMAWNIDEIEMP